MGSQNFVIREEASSGESVKESSLAIPLQMNEGSLIEGGEELGRRALSSRGRLEFIAKMIFHNPMRMVLHKERERWDMFWRGSGLHLSDLIVQLKTKEEKRRSSLHRVRPRRRK